MRRHLTAARLLTISLAVVAARLPGQGALVSPPGWSTTEAPGAQLDLFPRDDLVARSYVHIDDEVRGTAAVLTAMALRRDGVTAVHPLMGARTVEVAVHVGEADWTRLLPYTTVAFASLYRSAPTVAYTLKPTNFPNWIQLPVTVPAPFDLSFPFDAPVSFSGSDALMYELHSRLPLAYGAHVVDWAVTSDAAVARDDRFLEGCAVAGGRVPMGTSLVLRVYGSNNPSLLELRCDVATLFTYVIAAIGTQQLNVTLPGFCLPIRNTIDILDVVGQTGSYGHASRFYPFPHDAGFVGTTLRAQFAFVPFGGGVLAMSEGMAAAYPAPPTGLPRIANSLQPATNQAFATSGAFTPAAAAVTRFTTR